MRNFDVPEDGVEPLPNTTIELVDYLDKVIPEVSFDYRSEYAEALFQQGRRSVVLELKAALALQQANN